MQGVGYPEPTKFKNRPLIAVLIGIGLFFIGGAAGLIFAHSEFNSEIEFAVKWFGAPLLVLFYAVAYYEPEAFLIWFDDRWGLARFRRAKLIVGPVILSLFTSGLLGGYVSAVNVLVGSGYQVKVEADVRETFVTGRYGTSYVAVFRAPSVGRDLKLYVSEESYGMLGPGSVCTLRLVKGSLGFYRWDQSAEHKMICQTRPVFKVDGVGI